MRSLRPAKVTRMTLRPAYIGPTHAGSAARYHPPDAPVKRRGGKSSARLQRIRIEPQSGHRLRRQLPGHLQSPPLLELRQARLRGRPPIAVDRSRIEAEPLQLHLHVADGLRAELDRPRRRG